MVTWHADGSVSGFTLVGNTTNVIEDALPDLTRDVLHLASGGTSDANGITRLGVDISGANYRDQIDGVARVRVTTGEKNAVEAAGRVLGAAMFIAPDSDFDEGVKPKPSEIIAAPNVQVFRVDPFGEGTSEINANVNMVLPILGYKPADNTKVWVLVACTGYVYLSTPSVANDIPIGNVDSVGRAISVWTNRTPDKPLITSPGSDSTYGAGALFDLTFVPKDPDRFSGSKVGAYQDIAGVQVQYAPQPTVMDPTPTWIDLPITSTDLSPVVSDKGWYIDRSAYNASDAAHDGSLFFWLNNTMKVRCGGPESVLTPGAGVLPAGKWQIRVRTFDYGHPYPRWKKPLNIASGDYTPSTYAAENTSPWSDAVRVSISAQVPAPIPISPVSNVAIAEGTDVTLRWQYRNTYTPPYAQKERTIQMRKVGEVDWTTVVSGNGITQSYDLNSPAPPVPSAPTEYLGNTAPVAYVDPPAHDAGAGGVNPTRRVMTAHSISVTEDAPDATDSGSFAERLYRITPTQTGTLVIDTSLTTQANVSTWSSAGGRVVDLTLDSGAIIAATTTSSGRKQWVLNVTEGVDVDFRAVYSSTSGFGTLPDMRVRVGDYNASVGSLWDPWANIAGIGFENGSKDGWLTTSTNGLVVASGEPANAHSGDKYLLLTNTNSTVPIVYRFIDLDPGDTFFSFTVWTEKGNAGTNVASLYFVDGDGELLESHVAPVQAGSGWKETSFVDLPLPTGAVQALIQVQVTKDGAAPVNDFRLDDVSFLGADHPPSDPVPVYNPYPLEATTHYEWRVKVVDAAHVESEYSSIARFWVVPSPDSGPVIPLPLSTIDGATLGCGTHRVEVYRRGGKVRVGELTQLSYVDWGRLRDDISDARVDVSGWDIDCGNLLSNLQTWAYEIVIWRDNGFSRHRVWEGPITLLTYERDKVTIHAKDVCMYAKRRIIKQEMNDSGTAGGDTVVRRATRVFQNVFAPDDPNVLAYLTPIEQEDDAMEYRNLPAFSRTAYEEVDDMAANAGLDYCAVGRRILTWGTQHRIGTLPEFRDENFGSAPIVSEYGMEFANLYSISDSNGLHGEADRLNEDGEDPIYGLVEMLSSSWASDSEEEYGTYTEEGRATIVESFEGYAEKSIAEKYPPPVVVRVPDNTTLSPASAISIQHLVPGVVIPLRSVGTLRKVAANQKLDSIRVVETGGKETITVVMSPFSRDDAEGGEEEG